MAGDIKVGGYVVCATDNGRIFENGKPANLPSHFNRNSVGVVREFGAQTSVVFVIGENADFQLPSEKLTAIDPLKTGKGHPKKICNICHCLKEHEDFAKNQTDKKGNTTTRPSCRVCREVIDANQMSAADRRRAEQNRPKAGTLWRCPICRKQSIVGATVKIVLDHRHSDGSSRGFICDSCNTGLGRFKNGENYLKNAIAYVKEFEKKKRGK